jgi:hypothetical protein
MDYGLLRYICNAKYLSRINETSFVGIAIGSCRNLKLEWEKLPGEVPAFGMQVYLW